MSTNHASGGVSSAPARTHGRRHSAAEMRTPTGSRAAASGIAPAATVYPVTSVVHACCHAEYGMQSFLPLPHAASGVFHSEIESR